MYFKTVIAYPFVGTISNKCTFKFLGFSLIDIVPSQIPTAICSLILLYETAQALCCAV